MINLMFVAALAVVFGALLYWGFRVFPQEHWQILAAVPVRKTDSGHWHGENITSYGLVVACAQTMAILILFILLGAISLPLLPSLAMALVILIVCVPASRIVATLVEKKQHGFTVGGASFVGIVMAPWVIQITNAWQGDSGHFHIPLIPTLAAYCIAYAFGEGAGRLGCVTFGCCYGKPLSQCHPLLRNLFRNKHFVFHGKTKKIAYEGGLDGEKILPIQAVTAVLYIVTGLLGTLLFLAAYYEAALLLTLAVTQLWRTVSEMFRADYRGTGKISVYQILAVLSVLYILILIPLFPAELSNAPQLMLGFESLWKPEMIIFLQLLWVSTFFYYGRSKVTQSLLSIHLRDSRVAQTEQVLLYRTLPESSAQAKQMNAL